MRDVKYFAENIRRLRRENRISQEQMAEISGYARAKSIMELEAGVRIPSATYLVNVANYFGISIDSLFEPREEIG